MAGRSGMTAGRSGRSLFFLLGQYIIMIFSISFFPFLATCHFPMAQRLLLVLFLIGIFLVAMPGLCCVEGCSRTFSTTPYLLQHQKKCHHVQVTREKARRIRREKGLGATLLKDITSVTDRKQRLQVMVIHVLHIRLLINCKGILSSFQPAPSEYSRSFFCLHL